MAFILNIETSTTNCSVCIQKDNEIIAYKELNEGYSHSELLTLFIEEVVKSAGISLKELDSIAISKGPGSYTGLRIGTSTAKGLCFALDKPLIAVGTLESMAHGMKNKLVSGQLKDSELFPKNFENMVLCPMLDARRMEVYTAFYSLKVECLKDVHAEIITEESFKHFLLNNPVLFFGDGASKCREVFKDEKNALFLDETIFPSATDMKDVVLSKFSNKNFEDVAYFEPFYLKDFVATKPKKLL